MAHFLSSFTAAVYREYDRRIRRASLVGEYGTPHHEAHNAALEAEDEGDIVIANLPRGAVVDAASTAGSQEPVITNVPRGAQTVAPDQAAQPPEVRELLPPVAAPAAISHEHDTNTMRPAAESPTDDASEAEIVNSPPGTRLQR
jgi:hypothetical protein